MSRPNDEFETIFMVMDPKDKVTRLDETIARIQEDVNKALSRTDGWFGNTKQRVGLWDALDRVRFSLVEARDYTQDMMALAKSFTMTIGGGTGTTCSS